MLRGSQIFIYGSHSTNLRCTNIHLLHHLLFSYFPFIFLKYFNLKVLLIFYCSGMCYCFMNILPQSPFLPYKFEKLEKNLPLNIIKFIYQFNHKSNIGNYVLSVHIGSQFHQFICIHYTNFYNHTILCSIFILYKLIINVNI